MFHFRADDSVTERKAKLIAIGEEPDYQAMHAFRLGKVACSRFSAFYPFRLDVSQDQDDARMLPIHPCKTS